MLTPVQKLKYTILDLNHDWQHDEPISETLTGEQIDELWEDTDLGEAIYEIRKSGTQTGLPCPYSRHYETDAVAIKCPTGEWVGFTYWYGGGKHGNPEEIDWIEYAYDVTCIEERKMVTVQTFQGVEQQ